MTVPRVERGFPRVCKALLHNEVFLPLNYTVRADYNKLSSYFSI